MKDKLIHLIREVGAFRETYSAEIAAVPHSGTSGTNCEEDIDEALSGLENALYEINKAEEAEDKGADEGDSYETHMRFETRQDRFI